MLPGPLLAVASVPGGVADLYPAASAAAIDGWLAAARTIEQAAAAWCQPTAAAASAEQRAAARSSLEASLAQLESALAGTAYLACGAAPTIADVAVLSSLLTLYKEVLGRDVQQQHAAVTSWLQACATQPHFAAVLGEQAAWHTHAWQPGRAVQGVGLCRRSLFSCRCRRGYPLPVNGRVTRREAGSSAGNA